MRFLVDENLPIDVVEALVAAGHDAEHTSHIGLQGARDLEIWEYGTREGRIIVTRDLDFPLRRPEKPQGLIPLRVPDSYTRSQLREIVADFATKPSFREIEGKITVVSPGRIRSRELE